MQISAALHMTMQQFNIKGNALAVTSGVTESAISKFRHGDKDLQASTVERLLAALPDDAYHFFLAQLAIERQTPQQMGHLLSVIASKIEKGEVPLKITFPESLLVS
jgi:transcriptional regulator with XRE-family HTH domain